jgi:hypothetical protein
MADKLIFDEKTSSLYGPDGTFLKKVFCPMAKHWNQLIIEEGEERWRGCEECGKRVVNLDILDVESAIAMLTPPPKAGDADSDDFIPFYDSDIPESWLHVCVHASSNSNRVVFLKDPDAIPSPSQANLTSSGRPVIRTARTIEDINRAASMGYWPDVRLLIYGARLLGSKFTIGQHDETGRIEVSGDYRYSFKPIDDEPTLYRPTDGGEGEKLRTVIPFTPYYPHYQSVPVAAYLIPRDVPEGTEVIVADPIEDIVGSAWNQGDTIKAKNVPGYITGKKVVLKPEEIYVSHIVG